MAVIQTTVTLDDKEIRDMILEKAKASMGKAPTGSSKCQITMDGEKVTATVSFNGTAQKVRSNDDLT